MSFSLVASLMQSSITKLERTCVFGQDRADENIRPAQGQAVRRSAIGAAKDCPCGLSDTLQMADASGESVVYTVCDGDS